MASGNLDTMTVEALALLPPAGQKVEFNAYKEKLYTANPNNGRDVFSHMIKKDLIAKTLDRDKDGKIVVMLARKS